MNKIAWSNKELEILSILYPIYGANSEILAYLPGRTIKAIATRASKVGLKMLNPWNKKKTTKEYQKEILVNNIQVEEEYINAATKILHKCLKCNTKWLSKPNNILQGSGCPYCNKGYGSKYAHTGSMPDNAFIYLLRITTNDEIFLKIGISCQSTDKRIHEIKSEIGKNNLISCDILYKYKSTGKYILDLESYILYNSELIKHNSIYSFKGKTELFTISELPKILKILQERENGNSI